MKRALISVSDKTGIIDFAKALVQNGFEIISTGGTHKALQDAGLSVTGVSDVTGFPECLDGRVKTLHPNIFGGILAMRSNPEHMHQISEHNISPIDLIVVNLYPFKQTILKENVHLTEAVENIDIGGPSMLRAAAKNYKDVCVVVDPADYESVLAEIINDGRTNEHTNFRLAAKVFNHTAHYDSLIATYLAKKADMDILPETLTLTYEKQQEMRYGENPHQRAALYKEIGRSKGQLSDIVQLHGKELSFNNINDTHGALELLKEYSSPTIVACKHSNPCGVGSGENAYDAYMKAYTADPVSVFGGIIVCNVEIDAKTAAEMNKIFLEIVLAPSFSAEAFDILSQKKNIRLLELKNLDVKQAGGSFDFKKVSGGLLVQTIDNVLLSENKDDLKIVTKRRPTEKEMVDLMFTWKIVKYVKSNGIAIGKDGQSLGTGGGQTNRIWACKQAIEHCHEMMAQEGKSGALALQGAVLASDAFFPFPDCVEAAAAAGITAIIQPGGSQNDQLAIDECDKHDIAMIFTGMRHFRH